MEFDTTIYMGDLGDQDVLVKFDYTPGYPATHEEPECVEEVEITSVIWRALDIRCDLEGMAIEQLEQEAFESMASDKDQADEDRAERRASCSI